MGSNVLSDSTYKQFGDSVSEEGMPFTFILLNLLALYRIRYKAGDYITRLGIILWWII